MQKNYGRLRRLWDRFIGIFPRALPVGRNEFDRFCGDIFRTYNIPDFHSYRELMMTMIMHIPPTQDKVKPRYFAKCIRKAQANEVAFTLLDEYKKERQKAAQQNKEVAANLN